jgi:hypothetical protein
MALGASVSIALLLVSTPPVPSHWKVVKDAKAHCQVSVPEDWTGVTSVSTAPGRKASAVVHGLSREQRFDQAISAAKTVMKPVATIEEGPNRVWYSYDGGAKDTTSWYVAVPGETICTAQVEFKDPELEPTARTIVGSLGMAH